MTSRATAEVKDSGLYVCERRKSGRVLPVLVGYIKEEKDKADVIHRNFCLIVGLYFKLS